MLVPSSSVMQATPNTSNDCYNMSWMHVHVHIHIHALMLLMHAPYFIHYNTYCSRWIVVSIAIFCKAAAGRYSGSEMPACCRSFLYGSEAVYVHINGVMAGWRQFSTKKIHSS